MKFNIYGEKGLPTLFLLPGLGVSHEIFLPLIERLQDFYLSQTGKITASPQIMIRTFEDD